MQTSNVQCIFHAPRISRTYSGLTLHNLYTCTRVYSVQVLRPGYPYRIYSGLTLSNRVELTMQTPNYNYYVFILRPEYWTVGVTPSLEVVGLNPREILQLQHPGKGCQFELSEFYSDFFVKMRQFL
jgi:hypothetical protein